MKRFYLLLILAAAALLAPACVRSGAAKAGTSPRSVLITPVADILENPAKYSDEVVTVRGTVTGSVGLFSISGFTLSDRTGSIAVYCPGTMAPAEGETVRIKGTVHLVYRFGENSFCYIKQIKSK